MRNCMASEPDSGEDWQQPSDCKIAPVSLALDVIRAQKTVHCRAAMCNLASDVPGAQCLAPSRESMQPDIASITVSWTGPHSGWWKHIQLSCLHTHHWDQGAQPHLDKQTGSAVCCSRHMAASCSICADDAFPSISTLHVCTNALQTLELLWRAPTNTFHVSCKACKAWKVQTCTLRPWPDLASASCGQDTRQTLAALESQL